MTKTDENKNLKFDHAKSEIVKHYRLAHLGVFNKDIYGSNSSFPLQLLKYLKQQQQQQQKIHYHHIYQNYPTKYTQ